MPEPHGSFAPPPPPEFRVRERIVLKYHDALEIEDAPSDGIERRLVLPEWTDVEGSFANVRNRRLLDRPIEGIRRLVALASVRDKRYLTRRPQNFVVVDVPEGVSPKAFGEFVSSASGGAIESWYVAPQPMPPPSTLIEGDLQSYLGPANRGGIDARYAWTQPGGRGERQALYNVEWGWWLEHEDLAAHQAALVGGLDYGYFHHGTATLGIAVALQNNVGCIGIAPGVERVRCAGSWRTTPAGLDNLIAPAIWDVIADVVAQGRKGSVLLLEEQTTLFGHSGIPAEAELAVFEAVRVATAIGIVVVAPAGNGGVDLDTVVDSSGRNIFVLDGTNDDDSGAILVGSASSATPHTRRADSSYGTRLNCYGWGDSVYAPTTNPYKTTKDEYSDVVGQTSSATAMIAGVALVAQGLAFAGGGRVLDGWKMRDVLGNVDLGSQSASAAERIGIMPDLRKIIDSGVLQAGLI